MFGDNDLSVFFQDFGKDTPVSFNGVTVNGILDTPEDVFAHSAGPGGFQRKALALRIPYNAFNPMPAPQAALTVGGASYTVLSVGQKDTGIVELMLKLA